MDRSTFWGGIIGGVPLALFALTAGLYMSEYSWTYRIIHTALILGFVIAYGVLSVKSQWRLLKVGAVLAILAVHWAVICIEKGYWDFHVRILYLALIYGFYGLFGAVFIPLYYHDIKDKRISKSGIEAVGYVEALWDMGARLRKSGVHKKYKMKMTLRVEKHPKSPYRITDTFWVSEFYIHDVKKSAQPVPLIVDKNDHQKVVLNFFRAE